MVPGPSRPVENIHSPTRSCGPNCDSAADAACLARSSLVPPVPATVAPIEPETSITMSTFAGLRRSAQPASTRSSTLGAGGFSVAFGSAGSSPFASVISFPGLPSCDRKAAAANRSCCSGARRYARKSAATARLASSTHGAVSTA